MSRWSSRLGVAAVVTGLLVPLAVPSEATVLSDGASAAASDGASATASDGASATASDGASATAVTPNVPGRQDTGIASSTTGLTVVVDDLTSTPDTLDHDHPTLTVTGRIRLYHPGTGTYVAHSGGQVSVGPGGGPAIDVAEDGTFAASIRVKTLVDDTPPTSSVWWRPDQATQDAFGDPGAWPALIARWPLSVTATSVRFLLDQSSIRVEEGQPATVSGTLQRKVGAEWVALPGAKVWLSARLFQVSGAETTLTTDQAGRVSFRVYFAEDDRAAELWLDGRALFLEAGATTVARFPVDVIPRTTLTVARRTTSEEGYFSVTGKLLTNEGSTVGQDATILLQESPNGRTDWRTIARTTTNILGPGGPTSGEMIYVGAQLRHPSYYFRLRFAGSSTLQAGTSGVFRSPRRESRIASFRVTPRKIDEGRYLTFKGVLQKRTSGGSWAKLGRRTTIVVCFRPKSSTHIGCTKPYLKTRTSGAFSVRKRAWADGYWSVYWSSREKTLISSRSKEVYVNVR